MLADRITNCCGQAAKFDLLCLPGNLGILDVSPPHCYLSDAIGPKSGALLMVTGKKSGRITGHVDGVIQKLQRHLGVPVETMEDALCNWQKRPKSARRTAELGYVTTTCGYDFLAALIAVLNNQDKLLHPDHFPG